jgi:hypothetical protein
MNIEQDKITSSIKDYLTYPILKCLNCGFASNGKGQNTFNEACPKCSSDPSSKVAFPNESIGQFLKVIHLLFDTGQQKYDQYVEELLREIEESCGKRLDHESLLSINKSLMEGAFEKYLDYDKGIDIVKEKLNLEDEPARNIVLSIMKLPPEIEEFKAIVLITDNLLEMLLENFLIEMLKLKQTKKEIIETILEEVKGFERRIELFKRLTGMKLKTFLKEKKLGYFDKDWIQLQKLKTEIFLEASKSVDIETARWVLRLGERSFEIFAELNNRFCIDLAD